MTLHNDWPIVDVWYEFILKRGIMIKYQRQFPTDFVHLLLSDEVYAGFQTFEKFVKCEFFVGKS